MGFWLLLTLSWPLGPAGLPPDFEDSLFALPDGDALPPPGACALAKATDDAGGECTGSAIEGQSGQHSHAAALRWDRTIYTYI